MKEMFENKRSLAKKKKRDYLLFYHERWDLFSNFVFNRFVNRTTRFSKRKEKLMPLWKKVVKPFLGRMKEKKVIILWSSKKYNLKWLGVYKSLIINSIFLVIAWLSVKCITAPSSFHFQNYAVDYIKRIR